MGDIAAAFFRSNLSGFFRTRLEETLCAQASESVLERTLEVVDALLRIIAVNDLDATEVLHDSLKKFLAPGRDPLTRQSLEVQSLFHALLYATPKYRKRRPFANQTVGILNQLRSEYAIKTDASEFRKFFMQTLVPRIQRDREAVEHLAEALEMTEEVDSLYRKSVLKRVPSSPCANPAKRAKEDLSHSNPALRTSPRVDSSLLHLDSQVRSMKRNLSRDPRKEVSVKMAPVRVQLTPEHEESHISDSARALQEVNKKFFYDKKKLSEVKKEDGEFVTPKVLVTDTPKKEDTVRGRFVPAFRNIFS